MTDQPRQEEDASGTFRPATEMRLRANRPPVTRLSRKVLLGIGGVVGIGIGGALLFALRPQPPGTTAELFSTASQDRPEGLASLPHNYTQLPKSVPKLGPPLPGDLGKPILDAGAPALGMDAPKAQQRAQEQQAALKSTLFVHVGATSQNRTPPAVSQSTSASNCAPIRSAAPDQELGFLKDDGGSKSASPDRVQVPASRDVLQAGSVIPAALITGLRSDLPGEVTAQVTEDCYDSPTGDILLIPQGARLLGEYNAQVTFGQTRAFLVWTSLIMPNGTSIVLDRLPATDPEGYAGLADEVDNHWGTLFEGAVLSTILSVGAEAGTSNSENNLAQAVRMGASKSIDQVGEKIASRSLNIQPTITIRPGFPVRVLVTRDLVLQPYNG